jgi:hypothetical protein
MDRNVTKKALADATATKEGGECKRTKEELTKLMKEKETVVEAALKKLCLSLAAFGNI